MKTLNLIAIASLSAGLLLAGSAKADTGLTRQQVVAGIAQARANGELPDYRNAADFGDDLRVTGTPRTRAEVLAELKEAQRTGELVGQNGDGSEVRQAAPSNFAGAPRTRAEVLAELKEAQRNGELAAQNGDEPQTTRLVAARKAVATTTGSNVSGQ